MKTKTALSALLLAAASAVAVAQSATSDGEVRKIDAAKSRITLKHPEIKSLEMPPMTMAYPVKDKALLDKLKVGDKVRFTAEKSGGDYVVTAIEPAR